MLPAIPNIADYGITESNGFLPGPDELPLGRLPDLYYAPWEDIASNLQAHLLTKRLRKALDQLPVLSTDHLVTSAEWRRAYVVLAFLTHGYIWGGEIPSERVPPPISIPFLAVTSYLELPPIATYAGVCLWNFRPTIPAEPIDSLSNLSTHLTFTGSNDESWFYLVSVAMEARGGPLIALLLSAMRSAQANDIFAVTSALVFFAKRLNEIGCLLERMYEFCDPQVFYHRIRPFLAGSRNMADAGLPHGVQFDTGTNTEPFRKLSGGSNAQSSLIQFFDVVLGVEHWPLGSAPTSTSNTASLSGSASMSDYTATTSHPSDAGKLTTLLSQPNFIIEMRSYMPGAHARFLRDVASVANLRAFVMQHRMDHNVTLAYNDCLTMLKELRNKHIRMVSRYIIVPMRVRRPYSVSKNAFAGAKKDKEYAVELDTSTGLASGTCISPKSSIPRGTGGTALISFLKQARDETGEVAVA